MTLEQSIILFQNIATAHKQINDFGQGELWEIEGTIKPGIKYPMLWVTPVNSTPEDQIKRRTFTLLVFAQVKKDKSNELSVLSDCEQILDDILKILENESPDYEYTGQPQFVPFKEELGDWVAGYRADVEIITDRANNYCDVPSDTFVSPSAAQNYANIINQNGVVIAQILAGQNYTVEQLQEIIDTIDSNTVTIIEPLA